MIFKLNELGRDAIKLFGTFKRRRWLLRRPDTSDGPTVSDASASSSTREITAEKFYVIGRRPLERKKCFAQK